ncbi:THAP-type domain-containing protein [Aphis craccivora]|uniref:THAP-type domain-containing protein n=1 Tax=Aphis craccivora TaxID=307492 RepID=A0A6G0YBQ9_APHCR|nr:THAP-type domain-containing protein [Aphis craccivora]
MDKYKRNFNGISINGEKIRCIRFADDIALVSESEKDMQKFLTTLAKILQEYQMKINAKKAKTMVVTKAKEIPVVKLQVNNNLVEQVQQFKYLGSTIKSDGKCSIEIRQRIAMAKRAFTQKRVLLYGCETWTINEQDKKKLEAIEMWIWRRLLKISWTERKSNVDVLDQTLFMTNIFEGRINGYKGRGRPRKAYIEEMIKQAGCSRYTEMKRLASNREEWKNNTSDSIKEVLNRSLKSNNAKYSPAIRSFALTLQFYSAKAFNYVRKTFKNLLPHPENQDSHLKRLKQLGKRKQIIFLNGKFYGGINLGTGQDQNESDNSQQATNALVFLEVCMNKHCKVPLGYFLVHSYTGNERENLLTKCLELFADTGAKCFSITFDGAPMCKSLSANFDYFSEHFQPWFYNPAYPIPEKNKMFIF